MAKLSQETIQKQIARLQAQARALEAAETGKKAKAVQRVLLLMKKLGLDVADLSDEQLVRARGRGRGRPRRTDVAAKPAAAAKKPRKPVPAKYQDPATKATWTGRGRTPVWLSKYLSEGRSKEEFSLAVPQ